MIEKVKKTASIQPKTNLSNENFDPFFFHEKEEGVKAYQKAMDVVTDKLTEVLSEQSNPYIGKTSEEIKRDLDFIHIADEQGESLYDLLESIEEPLLRSNINISNQRSIAHLHCPPLLPALAAEMVISAFNQSMDSWDQSPAATYLENKLIQWLLPKFGYTDNADGTFTSGGTQSNYMGLLLARDQFCLEKWNHNVRKEGLPIEAKRLRILCSEHAHFTVKKSASQLGLGEDAVVTVKTNENYEMNVDDLTEQLDELREKDLLPFAIVSTCGTTDFGSIDPMEELASVSHQYGLWFHVDAAYGGALVLSQSHNDKISGIEHADSITVDFHKLFYQPISCGAFLVKNKKSFYYIQHHAEYLNPSEDEEEGLLHLVTKSTQTTRRFDALKLMMSLRMIGTKRFGEMIDYTFKLANQTATELYLHPSFKVINRNPTLNAVVFRYEPESDEIIDFNLLNKHIQRSLFESGDVVMAKTSLNKETYLKFTLLNPRTTIEDIREILNVIEVQGQMLISEWGLNR